MSEKFIAFDWCGWNENYGRFTLVDATCETLVQQAYMNQRQWDQSQLEFFRRFPGLTVYRCPGSYFPDPKNVMGTTEEIVKRLEARLNPSP